jgi:hypothetical protein
MDNVFKFPKPYNGPPKTRRESRKAINKARFAHTLETAQDITENLMAMFHNYGFDPLKGPNEEKDWIYICEAVHSAMMRQMGLTHPLHGIVEETISFENETPPTKPTKRKVDSQ